MTARKVTPISRYSDYWGRRLAALPYPSRWQFWCLAGALGRQMQGCTWVILSRDGKLREACIDIETGVVRQWGERI